LWIPTLFISLPCLDFLRLIFPSLAIKADSFFSQLFSSAFSFFLSFFLFQNRRRNISSHQLLFQTWGESVTKKNFLFFGTKVEIVFFTQFARFIERVQQIFYGLFFFLLQVCCFHWMCFTVKQLLLSRPSQFYDGLRPNLLKITGWSFLCHFWQLVT